MKQKIIHFLKLSWQPALIIVGLFVVIHTASAQDSLGGWDKFLQGELPSFNAPAGSEGQDVAISVVRRGVSLVKYMAGTLALVFGLIYAMSFIFARGKEDTISKNKQNFMWMLLGFVVIMIAQTVANILNPQDATSGALINFKTAQTEITNITNYLKWLFGSVIILMMIISSVRMITAGGDQETIKKEKKNLTWSGIGMLVILLATNIVNAFYVIKTPNEIVAGEASQGITEVGSIIRLLLAFLGPLTILITIAAGFMYLTSFENEDRAKTARKMIVAGVTGIVLVYAAYALVNTFLTADLLPPQT